MGNQIHEKYNEGRSFELYLEDLGNMNVEKEIGSGRLFTTVLCWSDEYHFTVVKVYLKPKPGSKSRELDSAKHVVLETHRQLSGDRHPNILPYSRIFETDRAAYLTRPYIHKNLTDRLSTRPFLNRITKKWITFQLLVGLCEIHRQERHHGDLKSSNVLLTGWDWVFLSDLANFKPLLLSKSNTRNLFSAFFDTTGRTLTTLAPERIMVEKNVNSLNPKTEEGKLQISNLRRKADVFSLGCVIAELFLEGEPLFQFEQLLVFRNGNTEHVDKMTSRIEDPQIREFVRKLLSLNPNDRPDTYPQNECHDLSESFLPGYFKVLHNVFSQMLPLSSDDRLVVFDILFWDILNVLRTDGKEISKDLQKYILTGRFLEISQERRKEKEIKIIKSEEQQQQEEIKEEVEGEEEENNNNNNKNKKKDEDEEMIQLLKDTKCLISQIRGDSDDSEKNSENCFSNIPSDGVFRYEKKDIKGQRFEISLKTPTATSQFISKKKKLLKIPLDSFTSPESKEGLDMIASFICNSIPNSLSRTNILKSLHNLKLLSYYCTDYTRLQRIIPYICRLLNNNKKNLPVIKTGAISCLSFVLEQVKSLPESETNLFVDYIFPFLKVLSTDDSELVRSTFALHLPFFANQSKKFLEIESLMTVSKQKNNNNRRVIGEKKYILYDEKLLFLRTEFVRLVEELIKDDINEVKISLLQNMRTFCHFCGRRITQSTVVPLLTSFLNSRSWRLRAAFFETVSNSAKIIGLNGIKRLVLPCVDPLLYDDDEFVVDSVLQGVMLLIKQEMIQRQDILDLATKISPLLIHPNPWIRDHAIGVFVAATKSIGDVDTHCFIIPILSPFFDFKNNNNKNVIKNLEINEYSLYEGLMEPIDKEIYERALCQFTKKKQKKSFLSIEDWKRLLDLSANTKLSQEEVKKLGILSPFITKTGEQLRKRKQRTVGGSMTMQKSEAVDPLLKINSNNNNKIKEGELVEESLSYKAFFETDSPVENVVVEAVREKGDFLKKRAISLRAAGLGNTNTNNNNNNSNINNSNMNNQNSNQESSFHAQQPFRPIGNLYTESYEHHDEITSLCFVDEPNQHFLISASKDFTVKVWDVRNLGPIPQGGTGPTKGGASLQTKGRGKREAYLFRSMLTYPLPGHHIGYSTSVCCLPLRPLIALTTSRGWMQIWDYSANRVTDTMIIQDDKTVFLENLDFNSNQTKSGSMNIVRPLSLENSSVLLIGTERGNVHVIDKKSRAEIFSLKSASSLRKGPITSICGTESWIVVGTERGFFTLWDLRFQLPVHTVRMSSDSIHEMLVVHNNSILVANASSVVHEWSLEKNRKIREYRSFFPPNKNLKREEEEKEEEEEEKNKILKSLREKMEKIQYSSFLKNSDNNGGGLSGVLGDSLGFDSKNNNNNKNYEYDPFAIEELEKLSRNDLKKEDRHQINCICSVQNNNNNNNNNNSFFSVGTDRFIRLWNTEMPQNSYVLSGLENSQLSMYKKGFETVLEGEKGSRGRYDLEVVSEKIVDVNKNLNSDQAERGVGVFNIPMNNKHQDSIVKCCVVNNKRGGVKLLTADKDGVLKFWD